MSDHWNSLANLLGTPSLAPQKPKTEPPSPAPSAAESLPAPATTQSDSQESQEVAAERPKTEKSRLKTSWDAVASFFGVTNKEEEVAEPSATEPTAAEFLAPQKSSSSTSKSPTRKGKPSMWGQMGEESEVIESSDAMDSPKREPSSNDSDNRELSRREASRRDPRPRDSTPAEQPSREKTSRHSSTREQVVDSAHLDTEIEPERRSQRRPPRRGRDSEGRESEPAADRDYPRSTGRQEYRSANAATPRSAAPSQEIKQAKKPSSFGAGIEGSVESIDDEAPDQAREKRDRRVRSHDYSDVRDPETENIREEISDSEDQEGPSRRRRRRGGRGRKQRDEVEGKDNDQTNEDRSARRSRNDDDSEASSDDAPSMRPAKIPSWTETISVLVEANMLNHQRPQSSPRGNPRGRGRR